MAVDSQTMIQLIPTLYINTQREDTIKVVEGWNHAWVGNDIYYVPSAEGQQVHCYNFKKEEQNVFAKFDCKIEQVNVDEKPVYTWVQIDAGVLKCYHTNRKTLKQEKLPDFAGYNTITQIGNYRYGSNHLFAPSNSFLCMDLDGKANTVTKITRIVRMHKNGIGNKFVSYPVFY